ncbi:hypothetical protein AQUCO_00500548v1 [Aquilegia coerulea]|uniref:F-box domain-containing protein n=1 Tax=Aquilegia coerulea TaxID=218851 RepID=A0A2G5ESE3_AQUCA|nr:hypothetical protein AQUCO_00500548v1 [Aquilegia coerulea]
MNSLPIEIVTEILTMLPFRSVLRFRSVCKTWRSIIDNSKFATMQFSRATHADTKTTLLLLPKLSPDRPTVYLVQLINEDDDKYVFNTTKIEFSCPEHSPAYPRPYIDGLFCFCSENFNGSCNDVRFIYIYNPATQEFVKLPDVTVPPIEFKKAHEPVLAGFGFDYSSKKYKVVQLFQSNPPIKAEARVFILGSKSWRRLENVPNLYYFRSSCTSINNSLHWLTNDCVLTFDLASENFGFIAFPQFPELGRWGPRLFYIMNLGDYLSISDDSYDDHLDLWIMKEYHVEESWTKLIVMKTFAIDGGMQARFSKMLPISLWKNGEILLSCDFRIFVLYNIESGRYSPLQIDEIPQYRAEGEYIIYPDKYAYEIEGFLNNELKAK